MEASHFYKWSILTTQTHTICRGALKFATQISPLLNLFSIIQTHKVFIKYIRDWRFWKKNFELQYLIVLFSTWDPKLVSSGNFLTISSLNLAYVWWMGSGWISVRFKKVPTWNISKMHETKLLCKSLWNWLLSVQGTNEATPSLHHIHMI